MKKHIKIIKESLLLGIKSALVISAISTFTVFPVVYFFAKCSGFEIFLMLLLLAWVGLVSGFAGNLVCVYFIQK
jgi:hypothetical protein